MPQKLSLIFVFICITLLLYKQRLNGEIGSTIFKRDTTAAIFNEFNINSLDILSSKYDPDTLKKIFKSYVKRSKTNTYTKFSNNISGQDDNEDVTLVIKVIKVSELLSQLKSTNHDIRVIDSNRNLLVISGKFNQLDKFVRNNPAIYYVGKESFKARTQKVILDSDNSVNRINLLKNKQPQLKGVGSTISIKDNLYDTNNIDLSGKHIHSTVQSDTIDEHATIMGTIIAGIGNTSANNEGVAAASKITSSNYNKLLPDNAKSLTDNGVYIQNHSYGSEIENFYGALAQAYDNLVFNHPDILHIFSAGNSGTNVCPSGIYRGIPGYANLTGNFKQAKNVLTIGAINYNYDVMAFSSKGPAHDGRIKPELVAYSSIGTSNSTALVSGVALLLSEAYYLKFGLQPSASTLKTILINSALDIKNPGPDFESGYGTVDAFRAWQAINESRIITGTIQQNQELNFDLKVPANALNLKATIVWTDPPSPVNTNDALVNNLDMKVVDTNLKEWFPWILDHSTTLEAIQLPAKRGLDSLNNIEQVTIDTLFDGIYTIKINGNKLVSDYQNFSICYQWDEKEKFEWHYPTSNDIIQIDGKVQIPIRWKSTLRESPGEMSISYDNGKNWTQIDSKIQIKSGMYPLDPVQLNAGKAILSLSSNGKEYISEQFVIEYSQNLNLSLNCDDNMELIWNQDEIATSFIVYGLQNDSLLPIYQTNDASYAFDRKDNPFLYFSVQPIFGDAKGLRSNILSTANTEGSCYFNSLFATSYEQDRLIEINLKLNSLYRLSAIELYKLNNPEISLIETIHHPDSYTYILKDGVPDEGPNRYLAFAIIENDSTYKSEVFEAFYLSENPYAVFPNPTSKKGISILSREEKALPAIFSLYSMEGKQVRTYRITQDYDFITFTNLPKGIYYYRIAGAHGNYSSKLIIQ